MGETAFATDGQHQGWVLRTHGAGHSASRPCLVNVWAASWITSNGKPDRSEISSSEWLSSEKLSTHSKADSRRPASNPPMAWYSPRLPNCGSHLGCRLDSGHCFPGFATRPGRCRAIRPALSARTKDRLSAEVWYSGKRPCGVRSGCRPAGRNLASNTVARRSRRARNRGFRARPRSRSACVTARSISALPRRLRL